MANKVRGDYELDDLAVELIKKLNHLSVKAGAGSFDAEAQAMLEAGSFVELWTKLVNSSRVLFAGDSKEVVDVFNVIYELLDTIDKDHGVEDCRRLAARIVEIVADPAAKNQAETRLIVLSNLYNAAFIGDFPELRASVLRAIVKFASATGKIASMESFLRSHDDILKALSQKVAEVSQNVTLVSKRQTLLEIYEALRSYGEATALEQQYLIQYLTTFDAASERGAIDAGVMSLACTAIGASIGNVLAHQGRQIQQLAAVKALASAGGSKAQLHNLLGIFNDGLLADYIKFHAEHAAVLTEFGIDHDSATNSMRLLSLCTACSESKSGQISYVEAANALGLSATASDMATQVESWVMRAIKNGLVDVKMCQQTERIIVYASTQRNFQPQQWKNMKKKIARWKTQINKLLVTVKQIKATQLSIAPHHSLKSGSKRAGGGGGRSMR